MIQPNESERLKHLGTGNIGVFLKDYYVTGRGYTTQIKMDDGRIYYAPSHEFVKVLNVELEFEL